MPTKLWMLTGWAHRRVSLYLQRVAHGSRMWQLGDSVVIAHFFSKDGKRLSHNPLNLLLLCVEKTEYHVIRVSPEGGLHECALDGFRRSCRLQ